MNEGAEMMPKRIFRSTRVRWAALIFGAYWLLSLISEPLTMVQVLKPILICVVFGVVVKFTPEALKGVLDNDLGPISQLAQGIWLAFFGLLCALLWTSAAQLLPNAEWMRRSSVVGFYYVCYIVAGSLHMTARRDQNGHVRAEDVRDIFVTYALGLLISLAIVGLQLMGLLNLAV